ncbi:MAG: glycosyltransferase family 4 protein [Calditrichaeota bacterium]|nr:glycosyltransferase family 4 protein [Calditrichota bacterium]
MIRNSIKAKPQSRRLAFGNRSFNGKPLLIQRKLPDYRIDFFIALNKACGVRLCYWQRPFHDQAERRQHLPEAIAFPGHSGASTLRDCIRLISVLLATRPAEVICEAASGFPLFWLLVLLRPWFGYRLLGWGHGINNRDWARASVGWRFWVAVFAMKRLQGMILYSSERAEELQRRVPGLPVYVAPNSLDTESFCRHSHALSSAALSPADKKLRLIFLGRLIESKKLDLALNALKALTFEDWEFRIIGDGPLRETLVSQYGSDPRIRFLGAITDPVRLGEELHQADLMLHPGNLGLAVLHSFAYACPILSCHSGSATIQHGPEFELLDESNSVLCDAEPSVIAAQLVLLNGNRPMLKKLGEQAREAVESSRGIPRMVEGFRKALRKIDQTDPESNSLLVAL